MNKEEIEKAKEDLSFMNEGDYITREMSNSKDILIKYIESLELINETWQVSNEMFRERTKELEQKESILDKVTDTLKEEMKKAKEQIKYYEKQYSISKERESGFYIKSFHRQINRWQSRFETCREILNIIEGEKNNGK